MNQKVVFQNFIIEPTGDKYFNKTISLGGVESAELKDKVQVSLLAHLRVLDLAKLSN